MTFDIGLDEVCVRVGGRAAVGYVLTKFSRMDSLPNFRTHGAPLRARFARESFAIKVVKLTFFVPFTKNGIFKLTKCGLSPEGFLYCTQCNTDYG